MKSRWGYLVAFLLVLGSCGVAVPSMLSLADAVERMPRVRVPGSGKITLEKGDHVIFAETQSVWEGSVIKTEGSLSMRCGLSSPSGMQLDLSPLGTSYQYNLGSRAGESMFRFDVKEPGEHTLACEVESGTPLVLAVSPIGAFKGMVTWIVGALVLLLGGIVLAVVTLVRRRRA
jgi:hypothetical protein